MDTPSDVEMQAVETISPPQSVNEKLQEIAVQNFPAEVSIQAPTLASALGPPPDGGLRAWLVVLSTWLCAFIVFGLFNSFGIFQEYYSSTILHTYSPTVISWIGSLQSFILFFGGLAVGRTFDAYGPTPLLAMGTLLYSLSIFMISLCKEYYQFVLAQGILFGVGGSMVFHPSLSIISHYFAKRRGLAVGIAITGSGAGGSVFPIMLSRLFVSIGFPWTMRIIGFMSLAMLSAATLLSSPRMPPRKPSPLGEALHGFKEPTYVLLMLSFGFFLLAFYCPAFYITPFASALGLGPALSFYFITFFNAGSIAGRLGVGYFADRFGRFNAYIVATSLCTILLFCGWLVTSEYGVDPSISFASARAGAITFTVIFGGCSGAVVSLAPVCVAQISAPHQIGNRLGVVWACTSFSALVSGPIAGALLTDYHGSGVPTFQGIIIFTGVAEFMGVVCMVAARLSLNKKILAIV